MTFYEIVDGDLAHTTGESVSPPGLSLSAETAVRARSLTVGASCASRVVDVCAAYTTPGPARRAGHARTRRTLRMVAVAALPDPARRVLRFIAGLGRGPTH